MQWISNREWDDLREWLLKDFPKETPLPPRQTIQASLQGNDKREDLTAVLRGAWHALKSYQYGNASTELAEEMCVEIERTAKTLDIVLR